MITHLQMHRVTLLLLEAADHRSQLKKVIPQIIGKQQKAYVEDDYIGTVLVNLFSSMKNYNGKNWQA